MSASTPAAPTSPDRTTFYSTLLPTLTRDINSHPSRDPIGLLANVSARLYHSYQREYGVGVVNWCGFYLVRNVAAEVNDKTSQAASSSTTPPTEPTVLLLGPFHGQPAVTVIRLGKGVCGTTVVKGHTQVVPDVHLFPGHIVCDSVSASEIVVPIVIESGEAVDSEAASSSSTSTSSSSHIVGVLDIDSSVLSFFTDTDRVALESVLKQLSTKVDWTILEKPVTVEIPQEDTCSMNHPPSSQKTKKQKTTTEVK